MFGGHLEVEQKGLVNFQDAGCIFGTLEISTEPKTVFCNARNHGLAISTGDVGEYPCTRADNENRAATDPEFVIRWRGYKLHLVERRREANRPPNPSKCFQEI